MRNSLLRLSLLAPMLLTACGEGESDTSSDCTPSYGSSGIDFSVLIDAGTSAAWTVEADGVTAECTGVPPNGEVTCSGDVTMTHFRETGQGWTYGIWIPTSPVDELSVTVSLEGELAVDEVLTPEWVLYDAQACSEAYTATIEYDLRTDDTTGG